MLVICSLSVLDYGSSRVHLSKGANCRELSSTPLPKADTARQTGDNYDSRSPPMAIVYFPDAGDIVSVRTPPTRAFSPKAGRYVALVVSPRLSNRKSGLAFACPIVDQVERYSRVVFIPSGLETGGVILLNCVLGVGLSEMTLQQRANSGTERTALEVRSKLQSLLGFIHATENSDQEP